MTGRSNDTKPAKAASHHTADAAFAPFITPTFDPTAYLNASLPPLAIATTQQPIIPAKHVALPDLASQTQTQLAQLSAQEARLVSTLTTLTDEILRSGSRLAYEVELLRGEAAGLAEVLTGQVKEDVERFMPDRAAARPTAGPPAGSRDEPQDGAENEGQEGGQQQQPGPGGEPSSPTPDSEPDAPPPGPPSLAKLRTLQHVRNSLQSVIGTFDAALSFPLPPSLLAQASTASSFVSVAAPADPAQEAAGQEALARLRASVMDHLDPARGGSGGADGALAAEARLAELKDLCLVWRETSEDKARQKVIDGWERELHEARDRLGIRADAVARDDASSQQDAGGSGGGSGSASGAGPARFQRDSPRDKGRGLVWGLRRLRDEIYLE